MATSTTVELGLSKGIGPALLVDLVGDSAIGRRPSSVFSSRLGAKRVEAGLSQPELARAIGISRRSLQRIECGEVDNPPLRYLANCALVLGCSIDDLIEAEWREWMDLNGDGSTGPPSPSKRGV